MKELSNGIKVYDISEIEDIKTLEKKKDANHKYLGYVYVIKYESEDNPIIKIGVSISPYDRIKSLVKNTINYGFYRIEKFALTEIHAKYYKSEKILHEYYEDGRKQGSEIFNVDFDEVCENMYKIIDTTKSNKYLEPFVAMQNVETNLAEDCYVDVKTIMYINEKYGCMCSSLYLAILFHYDIELGYASVGISKLSTTAGVARNTCSKYIKKLEDLGYIKIARETNVRQKIMNKYYIV